MTFDPWPAKWLVGICLISMAGCGNFQAQRADPVAAVRVFQNPILPGFHPDPSICRVGEDYFIVNSSFEYFPGVPIFHSKDLTHWEQIGNVLDRPSQLNLDGVKPSGGIYAATIRYHDGTFYVITTLNGRGDFIVTARDPAGPWSEPHFLKDAPGIDPSIFFDDDGSAWVAGNKHFDNAPPQNKQREIWLRQLDLATLQLTGPQYILQDAPAVRDAVNAEGPHLYKIRGEYYLMIAEGGTGIDHAVTISKSSSRFGPWVFDPKNPILTHRNLGREYPIQCTGHADLVETQNGQWWMVLLGTRPYGGGFDYNLGRETFLVPVIWQDGFPIVCPGDGKVEFVETSPDLPDHPFRAAPSRDDFSESKLAPWWNFLRTPREQFYSLSARPGWLRLALRPEQCTELVSPSWIGRRQEHIDFSATARLEFTPHAENESAGLTAFYNNDFHYRFIKTIADGEVVLQLIQRKAGKETILAQRGIAAGSLDLRISAVGQSYDFAFRTSGSDWQTLLADADGRILNRTAGGGFTGAYLAMYATSAGKASENYADFCGFEYEGR